MRIFDRYVCWAFVRNYLLSFMVLVGMYIVLDMVFNFDDMFSIKDLSSGGGVESAFTVLRNIADFYFYQIFVFFVHLSGIIPVVAAAFTLMRLSRFNEMTAMLAAGVPLLRVAAPILLIGLVLNALVLIDQELLLPGMVHKLTREHDEVHQTHASTFPIRAMQDDDHSLLMAARYTPALDEAPATMEQIDLIQRDGSLQPVAHISADRATWDRHAKLWRLTNGRRTIGLLPNQHSVSAPQPTLQTSISPDEIALYRSSDTVEWLSWSRINQLLEHPESYGRTDLLRVKHWRVTQPFSNFLLLLLAIPCVLTREPSTMKLAALKCMLLTGVCLTVLFLCHQVSGIPPAHASPAWADRWPAILAWVPLFIFLPLAVWMLDRVRT